MSTSTVNSDNVCQTLINLPFEFYQIYIMNLPKQVTSEKQTSPNNQEHGQTRPCLLCCKSCLNLYQDRDQTIAGPLPKRTATTHIGSTFPVL